MLSSSVTAVRERRGLRRGEHRPLAHVRVHVVAPDGTHDVSRGRLGLHDFPIRTVPRTHAYRAFAGGGGAARSRSG